MQPRHTWHGHKGSLPTASIAGREGDTTALHMVHACSIGHEPAPHRRTGKLLAAVPFMHAATQYVLLWDVPNVFFQLFRTILSMDCISLYKSELLLITDITLHKVKSSETNLAICPKKYKTFYHIKLLIIKIFT